MSYYYAPLKNKLYPTVTEAKNAVTKADYEPQFRDIRDLMFILHRISIANPKLSGYILTRRTAVTSYDWRINNDDDLTVTNRLKSLINKVLHYQINTPLFGSSLIELEYLSTESGNVPKIKKVFKPFEIEKNDEESVNILQDNGTSFKRILIDKDNMNYLFSVDETDWYGGNLRSVLYNEIMRNEMILEWANYNKKIKGLIQAKAPDHEKKDASNALDSFMNNTYAVTSKDVEFLVNNLADMKGLSSFKEFIAKLEEDTAIAILGQANTNQLPNNGSYSALNILNMIRNDIAFSDMQRAKSLVNESLLLFDYRMNIDSSANSHPYEFDFVFDEAEDVETNARVLEIAIRNGIPLSQDTVYNKLNIKAPETTDVLLKVQQTSSNLGF